MARYFRAEPRCIEASVSSPLHLRLVWKDHRKRPCGARGVEAT